MARPSICALALIAFIMSVAFHMPGVDADDAPHNQVSLNPPESDTGDPLREFYALLAEIGGELQDADSDDSAPETGHVDDFDPPSIPGWKVDEYGNLVPELADDSGLADNFGDAGADSDDFAPETGHVDDFDPSFFPGLTSDEDGDLVPELADDSGLAEPAEPMISLDELGLLPTGTFENFDDTVANLDDSALSDTFDF